MHICALCYISYFSQVWCSSMQGIYAQLTGSSQSAMHVCALCYIFSICPVWCNSMQGMYAQLTGGVVNLPCIYVHCAISSRCAKFGVAVVKASMLN